jgi:chromosome segregation ATPase
MNSRIKGMFDALEKELDEELDRRDKALREVEDRVAELKETESELREELAEQGRELQQAWENVPPRIGALIKAYVAHTSALTRAEHLDAIEQLSPALASVVRVLL